jgi:REP element-mobilizing transposase RayT
MSTRTQHNNVKDYYYIFNRGADGASLFHDHKDFEHFMVLLYIANNSDHFILRGMETRDIFSVERARALVDIVAYCLMPDQFHIVLSDRESNGTRHFIHKVGTAYVMYYNHKYKHEGTVFAGTYRARRVPDKSRLYKMISRVHLYPFSIKEDESDIKSSVRSNIKNAVDTASTYEYSSMRDYLGEDRQQKVILARDSL